MPRAIRVSSSVPALTSCLQASVERQRKIAECRPGSILVEASRSCNCGSVGTGRRRGRRGHADPFERRARLVRELGRCASADRSTLLDRDGRAECRAPRPDRVCSARSSDPRCCACRLGRALAGRWGNRLGSRIPAGVPPCANTRRRRSRSACAYGRRARCWHPRDRAGRVSRAWRRCPVPRALARHRRSSPGTRRHRGRRLRRANVGAKPRLQAAAADRLGRSSVTTGRRPDQRPSRLVGEHSDAGSGHRGHD
jgi:hypothetical protein